MTVSVRPRYTGTTPIATCHWQSLANILAGRGFTDAAHALCPTWGFGWRGDGVLYGGGRWPKLVAELYGVRIGQHTFTGDAACERFEVELGRTGQPFVAEVDAYHLPSPYQGREHVVHTVVVVARTERAAVILDTTNNPVPVTLAANQYRTLRAAPCEGRLDLYKLYLPEPAVPATPTPDEIFEAIRGDLARHADADRDIFDAFLDWYGSDSTSINVCRAAAERYGAARMFELLAERGIAHAAELAGDLRKLSDDWYLVHMLTTHERADHPRQRLRVLRLLQRLADDERALRARSGN